MGREGYCSACLRSLLKLLNFFIGFTGVSLLLYALWFLHTLPSSLSLSHFTIPTSSDLPSAWFAYVLLGLGAILCIITVIGHFAAETANGCCLSSYTFFLVVMLLFQGAFVADIFLNPNWEEGIPSDSTGLFDYIKSFIENNTDVCKCTGLAIIIIEAVAAMIALCIRAIAPSSCCGSYDSDDEEYGDYRFPRSSARQPLLQYGAGPAKPVTVAVQGVPYSSVSSTMRTSGNI